MPDTQEELLREMLKWLKFSGMQQAKEVVDNTLTHEEEQKEREYRKVYELSNGDNSQSDIAEYISCSSVTVGNWQKKWTKVGILQQNPDGKYEHLILLENLGLECPPLTKPEDSDDESSEAEQSSDDGDEIRSEGSEDNEQREGTEQASLDAAAGEDD